MSSAGSVVSLSSGEESDGDDVNGEEGETHTDCTNEQRKIDEAVKDEDILRRLYVSSSNTSTSADGHIIVKLRTTSSTGSRKGKEKLRSDIAEEIGGRTLEDISGTNSDDPDSSSDVEWEDVPMSGSHDQLQGAADLQEHGLTSRGFNPHHHRAEHHT